MLLKIINIYKPRYFRLKLDNKSLEISQNQNGLKKLKHCYLEHYESRFILKQRIKQWQEVNKLMIPIYERKKVVQDSPYPDRS